MLQGSRSSDGAGSFSLEFSLADAALASCKNGEGFKIPRWRDEETTVAPLSLSQTSGKNH